MWLGKAVEQLYSYSSQMNVDVRMSISDTSMVRCNTTPPYTSSFLHSKALYTLQRNAYLRLLGLLGQKHSTTRAFSTYSYHYHYHYCY